MSEEDFPTSGDSPETYELSEERKAIRELPVPVRDLILNPWDEEAGGLPAQIAFWREQLQNPAHIYSDMLDVFEQYVLDNNLENNNE